VAVSSLLFIFAVTVLIVRRLVLEAWVWTVAVSSSLFIIAVTVLIVRRLVLAVRAWDLLALVHCRWTMTITSLVSLSLFVLAVAPAVCLWVVHRP